MGNRFLGSVVAPDGLTFAAPVAPVPEANAWALFAGAALAAIGLYRRRARLTA